MKEIDELDLPGDVYYSSDHEWARKEGETVKIGISDYAQDQLGDIVFIELPDVGTVFERGEEFGTLESVKAVSEVYAPLSGEVVAVNTDLVDAPELVNEAPYENWIIELRPSDEDEYDELLSRDDYLAVLQG
ncbi:glycine cleavage system protein GcvH [Desulfofustis glycolicus]|jgi:glycine cleavage system H protein|uniref:Glycine cleavage system H protein n=1 Tax=Desulfofustis glycolicus DSM 9705 TaxID=1121409 RepID=A0A1M5VGC8_9BACT|nr:glycine cleavage system protein GcvH [Desulfofustis glycolicus]MCB2217566.1 glycine cleavage system protein GcvH [Desulfobulbaceae bacterium]SHH74297.1 glycine cleavage system H protein [Desulfofustis glycolicus DSM 9705]